MVEQREGGNERAPVHDPERLGEDGPLLQLPGPGQTVDQPRRRISNHWRPSKSVAMDAATGIRRAESSTVLALSTPDDLVLIAQLGGWFLGSVARE
jgi:hypothetical protein